MDGIRYSVALHTRSRLINLSMTTEPNPYQAPWTDEYSETWWSKIRNLFRLVIAESQLGFESGGKVITEGIAFYLDTDRFVGDDKSVCLCAASPSTVFTDKRMNFVVAEAIRVFPFFINENPHLKRWLRGRRLVVRLIESYDDANDQYKRQHALEWDFIAGVLGSDDEGDRGT